MKTNLLKRIILGAALAFGLSGALTAQAASSAKAVEYSDGRMVYYYDDVDHSGDANFVKQWSVRSTTAAAAKAPTTKVTKIVIDSTFAGWQYGYMEGYFWGLSNATEIAGLEYLNLSKTTTVAHMFRGCKSLTRLDLSALTTAKVQNMSYMFNNCTALEELDLSSFSSAALTTTEYMFQSCTSLKTIYAMSTFDLSGVSKTTAMFASCSALKGGKGTTVSDTSGAYGRLDGGSAAPGYFSEPTDTLTIDPALLAANHISGVIVSNLAENVELAPTAANGYVVPRGDGVKLVYTAADGYWFGGDITSDDNRFASSGLTADAMLTAADIPVATLIPRDLTLTINASAFESKNIQSVVVKKTADGSVIEPTSGNTYTIKQETGFTVTYQAKSGKYFFVGSVTDKGDIIDSFWTDTTYAENGMTDDTEVAPSKAADQTFSSSCWLRCVVTPEDPYTLTLMFNTTPVGRVYQRKAASGLATWNGLTTVTNVVVDASMASFRGDGNGFLYLFHNLPNVKQIKGLTNLNTSAAKKFTQMFKDCSSLETLDLSSFNTENVTHFDDMFNGCSSLTELDLSTFSCAKVTACGNMFRTCSKLTTIYTREDFNLSNGTWMFTGAAKLVGGNGTAQKTALVYDASYAHVDVAGNPGYFTLKTNTLTLDTASFASRHIASVKVTRAVGGEEILPTVSGGSVYSIPAGVGLVVTYTAASGYLFSSGETFEDETYSANGIVSNITLTGDAVPTGVKAWNLTVPTDEFAARHVSSVELRLGAQVVEPTSTDPNVYRLAEGAAYTLVFTAANGYCFANIGRYQSIANDSGLTADATFDVSTIAPTVEVEDSYAIRYFDGRGRHIALRDTRYPYSETESFALYDASSMAPLTSGSTYSKFVGWCESADLSGEALTSLPPLTLGDKNLYAKYEFGSTDWQLKQAKDASIETNWTGSVIAHASSDKVTAGESYTVTMPYRLHLPETLEPGKKYPLVLCLHGAGARGNDNATQVGAGLKNVIDYMRRMGVEAITLAPQVPSANNKFGPDGLTAWDFVSETMRANLSSSEKFGPTWVDTQWNKTTSHEMATVPTVWLQAATNILFEALANAAYQIDPDRVYVIGMSMGGYATWEMVSRFPTTFAAAIPCCGGFDSEQAARVVAGGTSIWAFHGGKDNTVPTVRSRLAIEALEAAGGSPRYREYGSDYGVGEALCSNHNCWTVTFSDDDVMDWLFAQSRTTAVPKVTWSGASSALWSDPGNWSPRAPQAGDDVLVDGAAVTLDGTTPCLNSLTVGANGKIVGSNIAIRGYEVTVAEGGAIEAPNGGAISFELTGPLTVAGAITAKGAAANALTGTDAGSGGSISIEAAEILAQGGTIAADGGDATEPYAESTTGRIGPGGVIKLDYQRHIQSDMPVNKPFDLTVSAEHGTYRWTENDEEKTLSCVELDMYGTGADLGTIWFADNKFMGGFGRGLNGELQNITDYTNIAGQNYNFFKGGHARLVGSPALTVLGFNIGARARLELGDGEGAPTLVWYWKNNCNLTIAAGGRLDLNAPQAEGWTIGSTNSTITVNGVLRLNANSTGAVPKILAKNFVVEADGVVSADKTVDVWAKTFNLKTGSRVSVPSGTGSVIFSSGKIYEEGDRVIDTSSPSSTFWAGSRFLGEITGATPTYRMIRGSATGFMMFVR